MTWKSRDLDRLLVQDVDRVVDHARTLAGKERTAAIRDSLEALVEKSDETSARLKILLFIQTLLATVGDRKLAASVADPAANELARVVMSPSDVNELKRAALDSLALLFLKAKELTNTADARVRSAFTAARDSSDPYLSDFARRAFGNKGVLSRRIVQRQHRWVYVSVATGVTVSAGYVLAKKLGKRIGERKSAE